MSRLEEATAMLDQALTRLERAASGRVEREASARTELEQSLAQLKTEHSRLSEAADTVSARLDGAIGRLRLMAGD
jgi:GTP1/Obg family GTP-binding protein